MTDKPKTKIHYEIYAPIYSVLHGMLMQATAVTYKEANALYQKACGDYLYVELRKITTSSQVIKRESP